jgi:GNAT superfamily N-acetyltransferase
MPTVCGVELLFEVRAYDDPDVTALIADLQQEYVRRYGQQDASHVDPAEFAEPSGLFLVCVNDGAIAAMGGWRGHGESVVEIKRMYVPEAFRRRGLARAVLAELERRAAETGARRIVLNTGLEQPEAVALYESSGYLPTAGFGHYADAPLALFFAKDL